MTGKAHIKGERHLALMAVIPKVELGERVDLIVMATHGRTGLERLTLGSVATTV